MYKDRKETCFKLIKSCTNPFVIHASHVCSVAGETWYKLRYVSVISVKFYVAMKLLVHLQDLIIRQMTAISALLLVTQHG